jgi:hypothetical protein
VSATTGQNRPKQLQGKTDQNNCRAKQTKTTTGQNRPKQLQGKIDQNELGKSIKNKLLFKMVA